MIDWLVAAALAAQGGASERHDHGLPFFELRIERQLPSRRTTFELFEVGEGEQATLLVERRIDELGGNSRHDVTTRECLYLGSVVEAVTQLRVPSLYVEGISPPEPPASHSPATLYEFRGFVEHPNGEMGEISLSSYDEDRGAEDSLRQWANSLAHNFEECLAEG